MSVSILPSVLKSLIFFSKLTGRNRLYSWPFASTGCFYLILSDCFCLWHWVVSSHTCNDQNSAEHVGTSSGSPGFSSWAAVSSQGLCTLQLPWSSWAVPPNLLTWGCPPASAPHPVPQLGNCQGWGKGWAKFASCLSEITVLHLLIASVLKTVVSYILLFLFVCVYVIGTGKICPCYSILEAEFLSQCIFTMHME